MLYAKLAIRLMGIEIYNDGLDNFWMDRKEKEHRAFKLLVRRLDLEEQLFDYDLDVETTAALVRFICSQPRTKLGTALAILHKRWFLSVFSLLFLNSRDIVHCLSFMFQR